MSKLYELSKSIAELSQMEDDEAVTNTLDGLNMEFNEKAKNIILLERNINSDIDSIDIEIKRLQARKRTMENRIESLKNYLRENMENSGITKIECPLFTISCVKGREIAEIEDDSLLPDEFVEVEMKIKPIKATITKALKAGESVPGARLIKSKSAIKIK